MILALLRLAAASAAIGFAVTILTGPADQPGARPQAGRIAQLPQPASTASTERPVLFGASAPTVERLGQVETALGRSLTSLRLYRRWGEPLFDGSTSWAAGDDRMLFVSVRALRPDGSVVPFSQIARAAPGSPLHTDMVRFAEQVADSPAPVYLTFNHEPEADLKNGDAVAFVAAWRTWVRVLREHGVSGRRFVWTVTGHGFTRTDPRAAPRFWPGNDVVDAIGVDAYNSYACLSKRGPWREPADLLAPAFRFAATHRDKPVVLLEWSSVEDPARPTRKAEWIRQLAAVVKANRQVVGLLQWGSRGNLPSGVAGCDYAVGSSPASLAAWRAIGALRWVR